MGKIVISEQEKQHLLKWLEENRPPELVNTYMYFLEQRYHIAPVLFPKNKTIYMSADEAMKWLDKDGQISHETEIKIGTDTRSVNEHTQKIYICPWSGKVFGDNTHPNPQDAIYDWVAKCPENTERIGGLRAKRFYVSEDPDVIREYMAKTTAKKPISKVVYSSALSGKLFNAKESVLQDFKKNYLKPLTLIEVQNQNRFSIEEHFLKFLQTHLDEEQITHFVEALADIDQFRTYVELWIEAEE